AHMTPRRRGAEHLPAVHCLRAARRSERRRSGMTKLAITGAELVDPEAVRLRQHTLLVEDGRIGGCIAPGEPLGADWRRVVRAGLGLAPGFIDLHFHGELVAAPPARFPAALARAAQRMLGEG